MPKLCDGFFQQEGKERIDCFLHIDLLSHVENFLHKSENVLVYLGFSVVEEVEEGVSIPADNIRNVLRIELIDLPDHGDTLMALSPVGAFDEGVNLIEEVLVEGRGLWKLWEIDFWHFDWLIIGIHANLNFIVN